ncbi:phage tail tube protein [Hydrogenophaga sp. A37]|uniref:phage tail tube protein n=1 Tax=Hydrogenophaga sp. A37 TaxID=1945864 RepID=UPI0009850270|nr:hypothetical protein [Hydrogenophaga sp. A37]OOG84253.1 hypothetical protein B0E41_10920 [Hydrogenophaga sp. A37]
MLSTLIFRPTLMAGVTYGREVGSTQPLQPIGGVEELILSFDETKINQVNYQSSGGGNRATVSRINSANMTAKLQDLNPVNLGRNLRAQHTEVVANTVVAEVRVAQAGGLTLLEHLNPTTVVVRNATTDAVIAAAGNFEVLPDGLLWLDASTALDAALTAWEAANPTLDPKDFPGLGIEVDYAHSGYDLLEVLTAAAPVLEFYFAGVNEAMGDLGSGIHLFRVQQSLTKNLNLISASSFSTLDIEGEVLLDPTKTGSGRSKYMRYRGSVPA